MDRYLIEQKLKSAAAFLAILILLPYIISVFVNGADAAAGDGSASFYVRAEVPDTEEADGVREIGWTDYLAGILAREMPAEFGEEAMKAQAVLIRTQIYRELSGSEDKILRMEYMTAEEMKKPERRSRPQAKNSRVNILTMIR